MKQANTLKKFTFNPIAYACLLTISAFSVHGQEQAEESDDTKEVEVIKVTVGRLPTELSSVPHSVTIISSQELSEQSRVTTDLGSMLANTVPGLGVSSNSNSNFTQTLRGRKPAVLIDGVLIGTPLRDGGRELRTISPSAIGSIEVIRGSSSVYGNGGAGGIINYITKEPVLGSFEGYVSIGIGGSLTEFEDSESFLSEFMVSGKPGNFDYIVSGTYEDIGLMYDPDGELIPPDPFFQGGLADTTNESIFAKIGYDFDDNNRLTVSGLSFVSEQGLNYALDFFNPGDRTQNEFQSAISIDEFFDQLSSVGLDNGFGTPFDSRRLPVITDNQVFVAKYVSSELFAETDLTVTAFYQDVQNRFSWFEGFPAADPANPDPFISTPGANSEITSSKKGLRVDFITPIYELLDGGKVLWGLDYGVDESAQPLADGRVFAPDMELTSTAIFAQLELDVAENFTLRTGFRYEDVTVDVADFTTLFLSQDITGGELEYSEPLFNIGGVYNLTSNLDIFGGFSQGFIVTDIGRLIRVADFEGIFDLATLNPEPQVIDNYELGIRGTWNDFAFTFAGYQSNSEEGTTLDSLTLEVARAPEEVWGYEATIEYDLSKTASVGASYTFVNGHADFDDNGSFETPLNSARINPPKATAFMKWSALDDWQMQLQFLYSEADDRFASTPLDQRGFAETPLDSFLLVDFSVSVPLYGGFISLGINNLLNEKYAPLDAQYVTDFNPETPDNEYAAGTGRSFILRYSYYID
ncbi:TonB-dependent receptor [Alteromonas oceanisediminis]|uniref:TonB-dependent receptor n=1 Tax=Alteromonas oceanisediminis TaxID=2836180 RepID=UPI001BDABE82|nr:TonB-dependent receptor [Alteromonas oceanisediminis]MBT0585185.1 TonB-dependent receptor [Alteromonas oceanisediminis]